ncbi:MAG TPA: methylenetetrahydrofolate reductase [NAD(P)H] [Bacillota bacterium]|nr:methylenetetrahydrofolate reductase [NAD(P)H] [Bacillota bacterium]HOK68709.1 methylenetetrahydrofolate reductase [NAD(P)H] [Bacillota bacterium]HPP85345.1 methylenetetrahydrofolate reductase [NAD(P)H] [Bacillota bacterium]
MKIPSLFKNKKPVLSFEIFPPKRGGTLTNINETIKALKALEPDYISVTFGTGGSGNQPLTLEVARAMKEEYGIEPLVHLTCINHSKAEIDSLLKQMEEYGLRNILALRGDRNPDIPPRNDFQHASDLIEYIKSRGDFSISGACYPEGHPECDSIIQDTLNLKKKVDTGAEHLITQLFFDNNLFYAFQERAALAGIDVPIDAGIMPVVNKKQIERMVTLCGASLPAKFVRMMNKYEDKPEALKDAGIAYAVDQIIDLISHGVDGIHLYTMNNPEIAERICKGFINLIK